MANSGMLSPVLIKNYVQLVTQCLAFENATNKSGRDGVHVSMNMNSSLIYLKIYSGLVITNHTVTKMYHIITVTGIMLIL